MSGTNSKEWIEARRTYTTAVGEHDDAFNQLCDCERIYLRLRSFHTDEIAMRLSNFGTASVIEAPLLNRRIMMANHVLATRPPSLAALFDKICVIMAEFVDETGHWQTIRDDLLTLNPELNSTPL